jgi:hypothetical protein
MFNGFSYVDAMLRDTLNMVIESYKKCPPEMNKYGDFLYENLINSTENLNLQ